MVDRRRRRKSFFDDFFGSGFEDFENMIEEMVEKFGLDSNEFSRHPFVYGFSFSQKPGEEPEIREFGNIPSTNSRKNKEGTGHQVKIDERKPLIDVLETENEIHVIAEMPGIEKEDIKLNATESMVQLKASRGDRKYSENIELPGKIDPDSGKATYKNGVLEIIFKRVSDEHTRSIDID
ncbi:archaeal heat shock protein Hsp20 [Methanosalsum natronophilum]|uniref:Hsp20/alpha crystallin family protein n=1 Tax=Methanosalsum natronophilum TaxID=768733 RepID=A0A3R8CCF2_9EURY|nr:archaeal heat shock protein Hsp20 [Methanosalsum natronophilum]MCS3924186.1 HSP20 family protein [Methanosalsum natronophilum]RQD85165.1 MAG: Hsp20/alpha crystallin family protein [Methanosalsum natronophilum]